MELKEPGSHGGEYLEKLYFTGRPEPKWRILNNWRIYFLLEGYTESMSTFDPDPTSQIDLMSPLLSIAC